MKRNLKYIGSFMLGICIGSALWLKLQQGCIRRLKDSADKNYGLFILMDQWVNMKQDGKRIEEYFDRNHFKKIAIYGMGYVGQRLIKELKGTGIEVLYGIDRNAKNLHSEVKLVTAEEPLTKVDAIVITTMCDVDEIVHTLSEKVDCTIIAIEDILNEI